MKYKPPKWNTFKVGISFITGYSLFYKTSFSRTKISQMWFSQTLFPNFSPNTFFTYWVYIVVSRHPWVPFWKDKRATTIWPRTFLQCAVNPIEGIRNGQSTSMNSERGLRLWCHWASTHSFHLYTQGNRDVNSGVKNNSIQRWDAFESFLRKSVQKPIMSHKCRMVE